VPFVLHALAFALTTRLTTGQTYKHNQHYLRLIADHRPAFREAQTKDKQAEVVRSVLAIIGRLSPPGRFLKQWEHRGPCCCSTSKKTSWTPKANSKKRNQVLWFQVEEQRAIDKIQNALREKATPPGDLETSEVTGNRACVGVDLDPTLPSCILVVSPVADLYSLVGGRQGCRPFRP
jgi:hypothetical protein